MILAQDFFCDWKSDSDWSWKNRVLEKLRAGWVPLTSSWWLEASPCDFSHGLVWASSEAPTSKKYFSLTFLQTFDFLPAPLPHGPNTGSHRTWCSSCGFGSQSSWRRVKSGSGEATENIQQLIILVFEPYRHTELDNILMYRSYWWIKGVSEPPSHSFHSFAPKYLVSLFTGHLNPTSEAQLLLSCVQRFVTPWNAARQTPLSITNS